MSAPRLHIVMPVSRPKNLARIIANYLEEQQPHVFELRWHLMVQGVEADPKGYKKCNEGAAMCNSGWLWFPSDDSLQEPSLFRRLAELIQQHPDARAIVFSERRSGVCPYTGGTWPKEPGILRAAPENMKRCHVDCTQVFFHHSLKPHFNCREYGDEADGACIVRLYEANATRFVFAPDDYVTFGSLDAK
jgi:hypothetical protein